MALRNSGHHTLANGDRFLSTQSQREAPYFTIEEYGSVSLFRDGMRIGRNTGRCVASRCLRRALCCMAGCLLGGLRVSAALLDPEPLGVQYCLLDDVVSPQQRSHFLTDVPGSGGVWIAAYRRPSSQNMLASMFDSDGLPVGKEIVLDEPFVGMQEWPTDIVGDAGSGRWLVTWYGDGSPGNDQSLTSVKARLFDSGGSPLGDSFQVNTTVAGVQSDGKVVFLADGGFVEVFVDRPISPLTVEVRARVFDASGTPLGPDFLITPGVSEGSYADVVAMASGGFAVVWRVRDGVTGDALGLGISEHLADGTLVRSRFFPVADMDGASWLTAEIDTQENIRVAASVFMPSGDTIIRLFLVDRSLGTTPLQETQVAPSGAFHYSPDLLPTSGGRVSLVWENNPSSVGGEATNTVLSLSATNVPDSAIVALSENDPGHAGGQSDATLVEGSLAVAVWANEAPSSACSLLARFFLLPDPLFVDGFESGDTAAWDLTHE
jgi:hypothetical protein